MTTNQVERRRWNDERWTASWPAREQLTSAVTPALLEKIALRPGVRVVDVGSGGGGLALELGSRVGPQGQVVGVDLSRALVELARARAEEHSLRTVTFVVADAQTDEFPGAPFDLAVSQFGVMFFEDPVAAFANIAAGLRPTGRLAFVSWQSAARNPWHTAPVLKPFVPPGPEPPAGSYVPGPFGLGDAAATAAILGEAGFVEVDHEDRELVVRAGPRAIGDPALFGFLGIAPADTERANAALSRHLEQFRVSEAQYDFPLAFSIWTARRP